MLTHLSFMKNNKHFAYFLSEVWRRFLLVYFLFCLNVSCFPAILLANVLFLLFCTLYFSFNFCRTDFCEESVAEGWFLLGDFFVKYLSILSCLFSFFIPFALVWLCGEGFFAGPRSGASPAKIRLNLTLYIPNFSAVLGWKLKRNT